MYQRLYSLYWSYVLVHQAGEATVACDHPKWQNIKFWILKLKLHSYTTCRIVDAGVGGQYRYRLSYAFQRIGKACPLLVLHGNCCITTAVNHLDSIPVCLNIVCHEFLELRQWNTVPCHDIIQVLSKYHLSSSILWLHIIDRNGHDSLICGVVNVASHGYSILDTLNMIKHDPCVFQISSRLHLIDQMHTRFRPHLGHLVGVGALT